MTCRCHPASLVAREFKLCYFLPFPWFLCHMKYIKKMSILSIIPYFVFCSKYLSFRWQFILQKFWSYKSFDLVYWWFVFYLNFHFMRHVAVSLASQNLRRKTPTLIHWNLIFPFIFYFFFFYVSFNYVFFFLLFFFKCFPEPMVFYQYGVLRPTLNLTLLSQKEQGGSEQLTFLINSQV